MNIISGRRTNIVVAVLSGILAGSAFGYWGYGEYREHELRSAILEMMADTGQRMRDALSVDAGSAAASNPEALGRLYDHAVAVDAHLRRLRGMDVSPVDKLGDAADDYVLTSREILLRHASSHRYRLKLSENLAALRDHMRSDDRTGQWVTEAVRAKERVEETFRDYRLATSALGTLLESYPESQAGIAPHVDAAQLIDDSLVTDARNRLRDTFRQVTRDIERIASLAAYR